MDSNQMDQVVENITTIVPALFKKWHKFQNSIFTNKNITYPQLRILFVLQKEKQMSMSALGNRLDMLKPNVTAFVDRLIQEGLAERIYQENDRRVIMISLTEKGAGYITETMLNAKSVIRERLQNLSEQEIDSLQNTLIALSDLVGRLEGGIEKK
jgi:DNA-binding MarR family transcriptional regulator